MNLKKTGGMLVVATLGGAFSLGLFHLVPQNQDFQNSSVLSGPPVRQITYTGTLPTAATDFTASAEKTVNAVVHVKSTMVSQQVNDPIQYFFYGRPGQPRNQQASGSGVIIAPNGYIVTNNHVVDKATKVEVILNDRSSYTASVVGTDPATDLALLKVDAKQELPFVDYGNSDEVKVGEWVLAVGNPFNLTSTVTAGIVSAKGRSINILEQDISKGVFPIESFIQTDAAVNPGNSGGALVNTMGELVGINTAIASGTGYYTGYSFAVPVNIVRKVVADLVEFGNVQRAFLGVSIRDIDQQLASERELGRTNGVFIAGLSDNGAAGDAGLKPGDIITQIGEIPVKSVPELQEQVGRFRPGDKVNVTVIREGKVSVMPIVLRNREGGTGIIKEVVHEQAPSGLLGAVFTPVDAREAEKLRIRGGAKVERLGKGKLQSAGVKEGFIITGINHEPVHNPEELEAKLKQRDGGILVEGIYPNGSRAYYGFGL